MTRVLLAYVNAALIRRPAAKVFGTDALRTVGYKWVVIVIADRQHVFG